MRVSTFCRLWLVAVALATTSLCSVVGRGQTAPGPQTLRVEVHLVNLFVNVTDAHGAPVADLVKNNFLLTEDGSPQAIAIFEKQTNVPLSLVLAIDTSGSTRKDVGAEQNAAHDFAKALLTPQDQLSLFEFNSDVREVVPFTNNVRQIDHGLSTLSHGPATAFYSAVVLASQALAPHPGRKVLVLVSDGGNTVHGTSYDDALAEAQRSDTIIYSLIDVPIEADAGRDTGGEHAMIVLSQETGGRSFYVDSNGLAAAFKRVSDDLRTQYLLGYYPRHAPGTGNPLAGPGGFRALHVTLQGLEPGVVDTPHYRNGYYRAPTLP